MTPRRLWPLLGLALSCGAAPSQPAPAAPPAPVEDEGRASTWIARLPDPARRKEAVKHLQGLFEDSLVGNPRREGARYRALLDEIVPPLSSLYTGAALDEPTRLAVLGLLADTRDARASHALEHALRDHDPSADADPRLAAEAVKNLAAVGPVAVTLADALWDAFVRMKPSHTRSVTAATSLREAVLAVKHASYGPKAVALLATAAGEGRQPEVEYRQLTAIAVIGALGVREGARPLVEAFLSPTNLGLSEAAGAALLRIPRDAEPLLVAALKGTDPDLARRLAAYPPGDGAAVIAERLVLVARADGRAALVEAAKTASGDEARAALALRLAELPAEAPEREAFVAAYPKIGAGALLKGQNARAALLRASARLYDPNLVLFVAKSLKDAGKADRVDLAPAGIDAMTKLMTADQVVRVGKALTLLKALPAEQAAFDAAARVVERCREDAGCYVKVLDEPASGSPVAKSAAVKACWMAGALGNESTRKALVPKLGEPTLDPDVRLALALAIDHLAPAGDVAAADALDKVVATSRAQGGKLQLELDTTLARIALKLRARAAP